MKKRNWFISVVMLLAFSVLSVSVYASDEGVKKEDAATDDGSMNELQTKSIGDGDVYKDTEGTYSVPNWQLTDNNEILGEQDINPIAVHYINNSKIDANVAMAYGNVLNNAFVLTKGSTAKYDLAWFAKHDLVVSLLDVSTGETYDARTIKGGSDSGTLKVPHNGSFRVEVWNKGTTTLTLNGTIDL